MVYPLMGFNPYPPSRERMRDPMLVLNMSIFNSADGRNRTFNQPQSSRKRHVAKTRAGRGIPGESTNRRRE